MTLIDFFALLSGNPPVTPNKGDRAWKPDFVTSGLPLSAAIFSSVAFAHAYQFSMAGRAGQPSGWPDLVTPVFHPRCGPATLTWK
ncbi:hypothetical protein [Cupriavidus sp.]|uniref:hypothetical protein n=1 Tax=Cupriavidus sp. TaxID=1873897 RepID=UPI003D0E51A0